MKKFEELTQVQKDRMLKHYLTIMEQEIKDSEKRIELLNNPEQHKLAKGLQERLVQCCIDYIKETGNSDIWRVNFTADFLQESAKHGKWCPCTDSTCEIESLEETISYEKGIL